MGRIITLFKRFSRQSREIRKCRIVIEQYLEAARAARSGVLSYCVCPCGEIEKLILNLIYWTRLVVFAGYKEIPFATILEIGDSSTDLQPLRACILPREDVSPPLVLDIEEFYQRKFSSGRSAAILQSRFLRYLKDILPSEQFSRMFPTAVVGDSPDPRDRPLPIAG